MRTHSQVRRAPSAPAAIVLILLCLPACAQNIDFEFSAAAAANAATGMNFDATAIPFPGGVLLGGATAAALPGQNAAPDATEFIIPGAAGFVFPPGHAGGVLRLEFAAAPETAAPVTMRQFPLELNPRDIILDGRHVEVLIAPAQAYQFIQPADPDAAAPLRFSAISFTPNASLSDPGDCECLQIRPVNVKAISITDLDALITGAP